ncbi:D-tyrosyl-tRNA(Tyr) deacylase [Candidatus Peregrinibacteria bacterium]|jgi:D-aminoacyl-tRNA deacylase|nr:D-tyrosyl-tRNA(Tyr) deacylase [Candidatus Peregrinibacteria bacterium]
MKALIQHVREARVEVEGKIVGQIGRGFLVFLGIMADDTEEDMDFLIDKITNLRLFKHFDEEADDGKGKENYFDKSILDKNHEILVVSQFTLCANTNKGRRPSFDKAAPPDQAKEMYNKFVQKLKTTGLTVAEGEFQAMMNVHLVNEGPITIQLDSKER